MFDKRFHYQNETFLKKIFHIYLLLLYGYLQLLFCLSLIVVGHII